MAGGVDDRLAGTLDELRPLLPDDLFRLLTVRDGAAALAERLPTCFNPAAIGLLPAGAHTTPARRAWELVGFSYLGQSRYFEALPIFDALYKHMLLYQQQAGARIHKGMPLVWISDCHAGLNHPVLAKRYLMLTLCEDALRERGQITPETTGTYFRLVWHSGLSHQDLTRYAEATFRLEQEHPAEAFFPEQILLELDQAWMTEFPSLREALSYPVNELYVTHLQGRLGDKEGKTLELLAQYLMSVMPGCRTYRRRRSYSTDYDIVCSLDGIEIDFRSELGRYFVCEENDWNSPADFSAFAKFARVLDSIKARFGILFSRQGISGEDATRHAAREQLKVFQDRGLVIVVVDDTDLARVANGGNLAAILREKYERVRL